MVPPGQAYGPTSDITILPHALQDLRDIQAEVQNISAPTEASQQPGHHCQHCDASFVSAHGLHMHVTRMHRDVVTKFIPGEFDRGLHATNGMPVCAACHKEFRQWKGLRDHLLSGACPEPARLRSLSTMPDQQVQGEALAALAKFRASVQGSMRQAMGALAARSDAAELAQRCIICGFWTPDYTKMKN